MASHTCRINDIVTSLGLVPEKVVLPNKREVMSLVWRPEHLPEVFRSVEGARAASGLGKQDCVVIDGSCPTWLLPTISHGWHPCATSVRYPQGGPDAVLPISGTLRQGSGVGEGISFKVEEGDEFTLVSFALTANEVDAARLMATLVAPEVPAGKPVRITGRGPVAVAAALAEAYAHFVGSVSAFQPGTGYVVCISHDAARPLGLVEA